MEVSGVTVTTSFVMMSFAVSMGNLLKNSATEAQRDTEKVRIIS